MNLSFLLPKTRRDFAAAGRRLEKIEERGAWSVERGGEGRFAPEDRRSAQLSSESTSRAKEIGDRGAAEQGDGSFEPLITQIYTDKDKEAGPCLDNPSGAAFSNSSPSEHARDSENTSPIRSADGPAEALDAGRSTLDSAAALDGEPLRGGSRTERSPSLQGGTKAPGAGELAELQLGRIREVWRDAVADVPYYARLVAEGRAPAEIGSWEDFFSIPELTREILQDCQGEFVRRSGPPDLWRMTGGSTGNPVKFGVWGSEDEVVRVLKLVLWRRVGYRPSDRLFLIWGHSHLLGTGWRRHWNHFLRKGKDALLGYKRVDAHTFSQEICERYAGELLRYRPAGLIGYSAALDYFVRALPERWREFRALGLKFVMPCAEPAPREDSFELLGRVFGCPVIQEFGGVDFGHVGMKLGDEPFVVFGEENFVETAEPLMADPGGIKIQDSTGQDGGSKIADGAAAALDGEPLRGGSGTGQPRHWEMPWKHIEDGPKGAASRERARQSPSLQIGTKALDAGRSTLDSPAEQGAALVTSLYRRYLPLIRYRQGDVLGGVRRLAHGHVASFERLQGRVNDMVVLEDGTTIHSLAVAHCIRVESAVLNMQMVLEDAGPRILLVTRGEIDAGLEGRIRHRLGQIAPALAEARIERVEDLVTTRAGKRRWVVDRRGAKRQEIADRR